MMDSFSTQQTRFPLLYSTHSCQPVSYITHNADVLQKSAQLTSLHTNTLVPVSNLNLQVEAVNSTLNMETDGSLECLTISVLVVLVLL